MKDWLLTPLLIPDKPLTGRSLSFVRALLVGISLASLLMFLVALPARWNWLVAFSFGARRVLLEQTLLYTDFIINLTRVFPYIAISIEIAVMLMCGLNAALLFRLRSKDWLALLTAAGLVSFTLHITPALNTWMLANPNLAFIGIIFKSVALGLSFLFLYLFPGGFYAPRWIRVFILLWIVWSALWLLFPQSIFSFQDPYNINLIGFALLMGWWGIGIFAQMYRYYRVSGPVERQQTKLVTFGAVIVAFAYILFVPARQLMAYMPRSNLAEVAFYMVAPYVYLITVMLIPITITFSIFRYRLWDIDLIIRRTLVYSALTATLAAIYLITVLLLQSLMFGWYSRLSSTVLVLTTLVVAALTNPLRMRIQRDIDRRFFRQHYDAEKALAAFSAGLSDEVDLEVLSNRLMVVVEETIQPTFVGLWLAPVSSPASLIEDERMQTPFLDST